MSHFIAFLAGVIVGAVVMFFVAQNNKKKADEIGKRLKDTLGKK